MGADDAGEGVAVGDRQPFKSKLGRARHHLLRMAGAGQKGEIADRRELGESGRAESLRLGLSLGLGGVLSAGATVGHAR